MPIIVRGTHKYYGPSSWHALHYTMSTLSLPLRYVRTECAKNVKGMPFPMYGVVCLTTFLCPWLRILSIGSTFYVQSIRAGLVTIACKTAKLFTFLHWSTQRGRTIDKCAPPRSRLQQGFKCSLHHSPVFRSHSASKNLLLKYYSGTRIFLHWNFPIQQVANGGSFLDPQQQHTCTWCSC